MISGRKSLQSIAWLGLWAVSTIPPALAAPGSPDAPPHASLVSGWVILDRDRTESALEPSATLVAGDRIGSTAGRAELLATSDVLHLDRNTTVVLESRSTWVLEAGRIHVTMAGPATRPETWRIRLGAAWLSPLEPGEYDVQRTPEGALITVWRGAATLQTSRENRRLRAGNRYRLSLDPNTYSIRRLQPPARDGFLRWVDDRLDAHRLARAAAPRLPPALVPYGPTLAAHGTWRYDARLGPLWYPDVAAGWRPYSVGRWVPVPSIGATWVGAEPWSWPTHHYGRWGLGGGTWFWRPSSGWGAGWVRWAVAPGVVGWCPLGLDDRPVTPRRAVPRRPAAAPPSSGQTLPRLGAGLPLLSPWRRGAVPPARSRAHDRPTRPGRVSRPTSARASADTAPPSSSPHPPPQPRVAGGGQRSRPSGRHATGGLPVGRGPATRRPASRPVGSIRLRHERRSGGQPGLRREDP